MLVSPGGVYMRVKSIPSKWLVESGARLDCSPYMAGGLEARAIIDHIKQKKTPLAGLTLNGISGIQNIGRIKRLWVQDANDGIPFLTGRDIHKADLTDCSKIAKSVVKDNPKLIIHDKWTLITRSGSIGQTAYARPEMDGLACTEDVLRVIPDESKIPPGYLYAFLSSKFGIPQIISGTYGAIIQHIEPEHIVNLPIPRIGDKKEREIHELVQEAAKLRSECSAMIFKNREWFNSKFSMPLSNIEPIPDKIKLSTSVSFSNISKLFRLDPWYYNYSAKCYESLIKKTNYTIKKLGSIAHVRNLSPFKRNYSDKENGYPFFGSSDIFKIGRQPDKYLSKSQPKVKTYVLKHDCILIASSGSRGGVIGKIEYVDDDLAGTVGSNHMLRLDAIEGQILPGYLFCYLSSKIGYTLLLRNAAGDCIPELWAEQIEEVPIPLIDNDRMASIDKEIRFSFKKRVQANKLMSESNDILERIIEGK